MGHMIDIDEIMNNHAELDKELKLALSTMERSDKIQKIRMKIIENQNRCPHFSAKYNYAIINKCPYCGFVFDVGRDY